MGRTRKTVAACVLAVLVACSTALPAAAATVRIVSGGSCTIRSDGTIVNNGIRCFTQTYRDARTGRLIYRLRITIPGGYRIPSPTPVPKPEPPPPPPAEPEPEPHPPHQPEQGPGALSAEERQMFDLLNDARVQAGLRPLQLDMRLVEQARLKSLDMSRLGYFGHQSPTYGSPFDQMKKAGIAYRAAGENLAGAPTVQMAHSGLMNSPGHRANILNPVFTHVGIGVASSNVYGLLFTQMFIAAP
ncbi:MAG: CAP domain-containing protein [Firmicutes bacterium]|nr:CAP domain-containing protein [Bacillota bacterium]